ncbi:MAG: hypothetical protein WC438_01835 [Candidatus Pacearchaeota archaeon]
MSLFQKITKKPQKTQKMKNMKITKILNYAIIIAVALSALSFFIGIIPCKTAPVIANPEYSWSMCKLPNPFGEPLLGVSNQYFGMSTDPLATLITTFLLVMVIVFVIFMLITKREGKVIDLTTKKR